MMHIEHCITGHKTVPTKGIVRMVKANCDAESEGKFKVESNQNDEQKQ